MVELVLDCFFLRGVDLGAGAGFFFIVRWTVPNELFVPQIDLCVFVRALCLKEAAHRPFDRSVLPHFVHFLLLFSISTQKAKPFLKSCRCLFYTRCLSRYLCFFKAFRVISASLNSNCSLSAANQNVLVKIGVRTTAEADVPSKHTNNSICLMHSNLQASYVTLSSFTQ